MDRKELWERFNSGERDFTGVDWTDSNLHGLHLSEIILIGANLTRVNLVGAFIDNSNLEGVCFEGASLSEIYSAPEWIDKGF